VVKADVLAVKFAAANESGSANKGAVTVAPPHACGMAVSEDAVHTRKTRDGCRGRVARRYSAAGGE
jgi:hypothetical protein